MTESLSPLPILAFLDNTSKQLSGGKLFTYAAGTTTKLATFTNSGGGTPNTNPVILNTRGEAPVWIPAGTAYKYVLSPSTDTDPPTNAFWTVDNILVPAPGVTSIGGATGAILLGSGLSISGQTLSATSTGSILQEVIANDLGGTTASTSLATLNQASVTITPKSVTSNLIITVQFFASLSQVVATNVIASYRLFDVTNSANIGSLNTFTVTNGGGGNQLASPACIAAIVPNAVLTLRSFSLRGFTNNASGAAGAQTMVWSIREVSL